MEIDHTNYEVYCSIILDLSKKLIENVEKSKPHFNFNDTINLHSSASELSSKFTAMFYYIKVVDLNIEVLRSKEITITWGSTSITYNPFVVNLYDFIEVIKRFKSCIEFKSHIKHYGWD